MPLPWAPKSLLSDTEDWSFANSANRAMSDLATMGEKLMQPVGRQVRSVVEQALPAPAPAPQPAPAPVTPSVPRFSLGTVEDWLTPATAPQPSQTTGPLPSGLPVSPQLATPAPPMIPSPDPSAKTGMFSLPSLESFLGPGSGAATTSGPAMAAAPGSPSGPGPAGAAPAAGGDLREYARAVAGRYGVDPGIFERQIAQESGFNPKAVSPAGAQGIAQFMPATAKGVGLADPFEPYAALDAAARHMRDNLAANGDDYARALGAYNAGQGAVNRYGGVPPFAETREYVRAILGDERPTAASAQPAAPRQSTQPAAGLDVQGITAAYKGVPYTFGGPGGRGQGVGATTDCSGFVSAVWKNQYGLDLPAHTDTSYNALRKLGAPEVSAADARSGDVVYYMGAGTGGAITHHMGLVSGPGRVLDMSTSGGSGVRERDIGHAGRYVILRDPRVSQQPARSAQAAPPIVPSGVAEQSGGQRLSRQEINAASEQPALASRTAVETPAEGTPVAEAITATPQPTFAAPFQDEQREPAAPPEPESVWSAFQAVNGRSPTGRELMALVSRVYGGLGG